MSTILIGGYYGAGNIGDEAILASIVNELRAQRPNNLELSFIVISWDPKKTSKEHDVDSIHWKDMSAIVDASMRADLIIVGGGGIFQDYWGIDPTTYLRKSSRDITAFGSLPILAKLLNTPCMIYSVGVGPFQSELAKYHTRLAFEKCQIATVRDEESLRYLLETGFNLESSNGPQIEILPDPVFTLTTYQRDETQVKEYLQQNKIDLDKPLLGISLRHWDIGVSPEEWLSSIISAVKNFLSMNERAGCILIPFQVLHATPFTNDVTILQKLADGINMPDRLHLIEEQPTPQFAQALIKHCKVILGMRLHSVISAINVSTPVVALSYAPKVKSAMEYVGLEDFCNDTLQPKAAMLTDQIQKAWNYQENISSQMHSKHSKISNKSRKAAQLALNLLKNYKHRPIEFSSEFAIKKIKETILLDSRIEKLRYEKDELQNQIWKLDRQLLVTNQSFRELHSQLNNKEAENFALKSQLDEIQNSRVWKLGQRYYHIRDSTPLRYIYRFLVVTKREGLCTAFHKIFDHLRVKQQTAEEISTKIESQANLVIQSFVSELNKRSLKGVFVLTSAFEFDEFYNQRVINLSKYLASHGWGVIYVAWVWEDEKEAPPKEIKENIFQVPMNFFLNGYSNLKLLVPMRKYFIAEFPHPDFLSVALHLRIHGFAIIYDIIDEWEAFHKVDQAHWYQKNFEESIVLNANYLTAVSKPLIDKFSHLRKDIHLIPNGFDPAFLGDFQLISKEKLNKQNINIGYFGHLTPAWFDWKFIKDVLDQAKTNSINLIVHIIGYGEPDLSKMLGDYKDSLVFHGRVPPSDLYIFAKNWDLAMIPFKSGKLSEAVDPIKIYEYLYFGLPVIVKGIPHLDDLPNVSVVDNVDQFFEVLNNLSMSNKYQSQSIDTFEFTWEKRFSKFLKILEDETWMSL